MKDVDDYTQKKTEENNLIVAKLCDSIKEAKLNNQDLVGVLSHFVFSIGASLETCENLTSQEVLTRYASNPTLGNALMAQALHMKETWSQKEQVES